MALSSRYVGLLLFVAVSLIACGDRETGTPTAQPSAPAVPTNTPTAPPPSETTEEFPAKALTLGPDVAFPANTAILVAEGSYGHGHGGIWTLTRFERRGSAPVTSTVLMSLSPANRETKNITGIVASDDLDTIFVSRCVGDDCLYEGGPKSAVTEFLRSTDGGATWQKVFELQSEWRVALVTPDGALAFEVDRHESGWVGIPGGAATTAPAAAELPWPVMAAGNVVWVQSQEPTIVDSAGTTIYTVPSRLNLHSVQALHSTGAVWVVRGYARSGSVFLGVSTSIGKDFSALYRLELSVSLADWLADPDTLVVGAGYTGRPRTCGGITYISPDGNAPAVVDFRTGTIAFIADLQLCSPGARVVGVARLR